MEKFQDYDNAGKDHKRQKLHTIHIFYKHVSKY